MNFEQLATIITDTHQQLQQSAVKAVNQCQTVRNWLMGFYIVEFEQNGEDRAVSVSYTHLTLPTNSLV